MWSPQGEEEDISKGFEEREPLLSDDRFITSTNLPRFMTPLVPIGRRRRRGTSNGKAAAGLFIGAS